MDRWVSTFESGLNPRTLQRLLGEGKVEMTLDNRTGNYKRYWRWKDAPDQKHAA